MLQTLQHLTYLQPGDSCRNSVRVNTEAERSSPPTSGSVSLPQRVWGPSGKNSVYCAVGQDFFRSVLGSIKATKKRFIPLLNLDVVVLYTDQQRTIQTREQLNLWNDGMTPVCFIFFPSDTRTTSSTSKWWKTTKASISCGRRSSPPSTSWWSSTRSPPSLKPGRSTSTTAARTAGAPPQPSR